MGIPFYYICFKISMPAVWKKKFENKIFLQSQKSNLVEIMYWYVVDVGVLQLPEGVSAGGPLAAPLSRRPGPRLVDLNPWHYSLNQKK